MATLDLNSSADQTSMRCKPKAMFSPPQIFSCLSFQLHFLALIDPRSCGLTGDLAFAKVDRFLLEFSAVGRMQRVQFVVVVRLLGEQAFDQAEKLGKARRQIDMAVDFTANVTKHPAKVRPQSCRPSPAPGSFPSPKCYRRGFSDLACREMAERALRSELGQEALRQGWGRGLYRFVMDWASTPARPETKAALHRAANDLLWDLGDLRKIEEPSELDKANIRLIKAAVAHESDLKRRFWRGTS